MADKAIRKILFLAANPQATSRQHIDEEVRDIEEGLRRAQEREKFLFIQRWAVRTRDLQRALLDTNPQIVHFSGYGASDEGIIFENHTGQASLVNIRALSSLFRLFSASAEEQVMCVILSGCFTQEQAEAIAIHIPYVIGLRQTIPREIAIEFSIGFYDALWAGRSVKFAYELGCISAQMLNSFTGQTPVLLHNSLQGSVKEITVEIETLSSENLGESTITSDLSLSSNHSISKGEKANHYLDTKKYCRQKINSQHNKIRLLSGKEIEVDKLYVDVWLLSRLPKTLQISPSKFLENFDLRNDRLGLGNRIERLSGFEVANKESKIVILGKPGSGKTTFLKNLAVNWCKGTFKNHLISIFIEFRKIRNPHWDFLDTIDRELGFSNWIKVQEILPKIEKCSYILSRLEKASPEEKDQAAINRKRLELSRLQQEVDFLRREVSELLEQGQLLIFMDGLDELPTQELRYSAQQQLQSISEDYPQNQFILTCRTQIMTSIPDGFVAVEVADFNEHQVKRFVDNWFFINLGSDNSLLTEKWNIFSKTISSSPSMKELTGTPVLLSLMCLILQDEGEMPSESTWLYKKGVKLLLSKWNTRKSIENWEIGCENYRKLTVEEKESLLVEIAARKFDSTNSLVLFEQDEIASHISEILKLSNLKEGIDVLRTIEAQHGLLIERADELWSYSHLTFQEHFAVQWLIDLSPDVLIGKIQSQHWKDIIRQLVKSQKPADQLVTALYQAIQQSTSNDLVLNKFLRWTSQKSNQVCTNYKASAMRAFYFSTEFHRSIHQNFSLSKNLRLANRIDRTWDVKTPLEDEIKLDMIFHIALDLNNSIQKQRGESSINRARASALERSFTFSLHLAMDFNENLAKELKPLKDLLPRFSLLDQRFIIWWRSNGEQWLQGLQQLMIKYRNIGHYWELEDEQRKSFQRYYDNNDFLIEIMGIPASVDSSLYESVNDQLFLPADYYKVL